MKYWITVAVVIILSEMIVKIRISVVVYEIELSIKLAIMWQTENYQNVMIYKRWEN